jgi:mono/diheme cytochrome c family protein/cytochrome c553
MKIATRASRNSRTALHLAFSGGLAAAGGCLSPTAPVSSSRVYVTTGGGGDDGAFAADDSGTGDFLPFDGGGGVVGCLPQAPPPDFGAPVTCSTPPPPISGGTLLVTRDGSAAIAADPDRNAVYVVDLASRTLKFTIALQTGDEPGRLTEDGAGRIHVALRGSGVLATIDPGAGTVTARRAVCPAPRGVAWQASSDTVWVACATGELASLPAAGGDATVKVIARDLRDVIVNGDAIAVTQFRSAQILRLAADGTVTRTDPMPSDIGAFASHVAWRAVPGPGGTVVAVHQAESTQFVSTKLSGGYGCGGIGGGSLALLSPRPLSGEGGFDLDDAGPATTDIRVPSPPPPFGAPVSSVLRVLASDGTATATQMFGGVLPVDVAISPDGSTIAAVAAGAGTGSATVGNLFLFNAAANLVTEGFMVPAGQATAAAFAPNGDLVLQSRQPAALWIAQGAGDAGDSPAVFDGGNIPSISLSSISVQDTGHDIFHTHAGALIACASCHPEGGDDGHVWLLDGNKRRTPSLRGTIAGTAPYHWPGDEADFSAIVKDVYEVRMSGGPLTTGQTSALSAWVNALPAPPAPTWVDASAAAAGRAIFQRADVGCATCHSGTKFTDNATVDVGTGGAFQVPPLVGVGWRTPLMHDGCASTIADRFGACATSQHGNIASLSPTDVANLTAYLETL